MVLTAVPTGTGQLEVRAGEPDPQGGVSENGGAENGVSENGGSGNETPATLSGNGTEADPYIIADDDDWTLFAAHVADENNTYDGMYYKLGNNIHITMPVGSEAQPFTGVFDGDGKTLNVAIDDTTQQGTAPFRYVQDATIQNLTATGSVNGTLHAAGLVGFSKKGSDKTTISDCYVDVDVTASVADNNKTHIGGVVGHGLTSTMVFKNIVYSGDLTNISSYAGGILGWCSNKSETNVSFSNCLFIGTYTGSGWVGPIGLKDGPKENYVKYTVDEKLYYVAYDGMKTIPDNYNEVFFPIYRVYRQPEGFYETVECADHNQYYYKRDLSFVNLSSFYYVGETPAPTVKIGSTVLTEGTDYVLKCRKGEQIYSDLSSLTEFGNYTIIAEGIGNYAGSAEGATFEMIKAPQGTGTEDDPYLISTSDDWNAFATMTAQGANTGAYYKLTADIEVSKTVGTQDHPFKGVFDGGNKTLNVQITDTANMGTAPFRCIQDAVIQNLKVTGSVTGTIHAAGLVGLSKRGNTKNTIKNCVVGTNVAVNVPKAGTDDYHMGGVVGHGFTSVLEMENVVYSGNMSSAGTKYAGGLLGWSDGSTLNLKHCLFSGTYTGNAKFHPIAVKNQGETMTVSTEEVYYTQTPMNSIGSGYIAAEGVRVYSEPQQEFCQKLTFLDGSSYYRIAESVTNGLREGYFVEEGESFTPRPTVTCDGEVLSENDYTVTYYKDGSQVNTPLPVGTYTMTITGSGNYAGSAEGYGFEISNSVSLQGEGSETAPYRISSAEDWELFAKQIKFGNDEGKYFELTNDILVTDAVGVQTGPFMGTFDGKGHTLTVSMNDISHTGTAPFRYIKNATIQNLTVTGTVTGTAHAAGLVGYSLPGNGKNTIKNCVVKTDVDVSTATNGNYYMGGVVGHGSTSVLEMENVVYSGHMTNVGGNAVGGLLGWSGSATLNLKHCIFKGTYERQSGSGTFYPIAVKDKSAKVTASVSDVYKTVNPQNEDVSYLAADGRPATTGQANSFNKKLTFPDNSTYYYVGFTEIGDGQPAYAPVGTDPELTVTFDGETLTKDQDYTVSFQKDGVDVSSPLAEGTYTMTITGMGDYVGSAVSDSFELRNFLAQGNGTQQSPYKIASADDWKTFAKQISYGKDADKYFELTNNIDVTETVGSEEYPFKGVFNGNDHTLTVSMNDTSNMGTAPFRYIKEASIHNMTVEGTVNGSIHAGGLVGFSVPGSSSNTIKDCIVKTDVTVNVPNGSNFHMGGVVGHGSSSELYLENIVYSGHMSNTVDPSVSGAVTAAGGIVGWSDTGAKLHFKNCLFSGNYEGGNVFHPLALRCKDNRVSSTVEKCYTTAAATIGSSDGRLVADMTRVYEQPQEDFCKKLEFSDGSFYYYVGKTVIGSGQKIVYIAAGSNYDPGVTFDGAALTCDQDYEVSVQKDGVDVTQPLAEGTYVLTITGKGEFAGSAVSSEFQLCHVVAQGDGTAQSPYLITSADDWNVFAKQISYGKDADKYFELTSDIEVTQTVGSESYPFKGVFDGKGHTLTVSITDTSNGATAPFRYIKDATIKNLNVTGTVTGTIHAAGLAGYSWPGNDKNTIQNCVVDTDVVVNVPNVSNYHMGGVVGHGKTSVLVMENVTFTGTMSSSGSYAGGLLGWSDGSTLNLDRCFFKGSYTGKAAFHPIAVRNNNKTMTVTESDVYYLEKPVNIAGKNIAANGTPVYTKLTEETPIVRKETLFDGNEYYVEKALTVTGVDDVYVCTGSPISITPQVTFGDTSMTAESDYTISIYRDGQADAVTQVKDAGRYTIEINGIGNYYGSKKISFTVTYEGEGSAESPYLIKNAADWDLFAEETAKGKNTDKHYRLVNDITVSTMAASSDHPFNGTFDGNGKTLTVHYNVVDEKDAAPFKYISSPTIKNLRIAGTIETNDQFAAGLAGHCNGAAHIENCVSEVTIISTMDGDGTHGGFIGVINGGYHPELRNCCFSGRLLGPDTHSCGGFVGYNSANPHLYDCIFCPKEVTFKTDHAFTFVRVNDSGASAVVYYTDCYYTTPYGRTAGTKAYEQMEENTFYRAISVSDNTVFAPVEFEMTGVETSYMLGDATGIIPVIKIDGKDAVAGLDYTLTLDGVDVTGRAGFDISVKGTHSLVITGITYAGSIEKKITVSSALQQDTDGNYLIEDIYDWHALSLEVAGGNTFGGKTVKLMNNITVDVMVGGDTAETAFAGTFDGNGKKITVDYKPNVERCGPFMSLNGAVIKNLTVDGQIVAKKRFAGSITGYNYGNTTITDCTGSVTIKSVFTSSDDGTYGGFVGCNDDSGKLVFERCIFNGKLLGENAAKNGGFLGFNRNRASGSIRYTDCLFMPSEITMSASESAVFNRQFDDAKSDASMFTRTYYLTAYGKAQGQRAFAGSDTDGAMAYVDDGGSIRYTTLFDGKAYLISGDVKISGLSECTTNDLAHFDPKAVVTFNGERLTIGTDYALDITKKGETQTIDSFAYDVQYTAHFTGVANYYFKKSIDFYVTPALPGKGTEADPFLISSAGDWSVFADMIGKGVNADKYYKLTNNITVTEMVGDDNNGFKGTFDGGDKTITFLSAIIRHCLAGLTALP